MPRKRLKPEIQCAYFRWILTERSGVYGADGRANSPSVGRHSLGTRDLQEARKLLSKLDRKMAEAHGLAPKEAATSETEVVISLLEGRTRYEAHAARPRSVGGMKASSRKRNRTVFDKFLKWAEENRINAWNAVTASVLTQYATFLEDDSYAHQTQRIELTALKGVHKWLLASGQMKGPASIVLPLKRAEGESPHCYTRQEVAAMVAHCQGRQEFAWIRDVIISLACTGLRISELAELRWSDIDMPRGMLLLSDESGYAPKGRKKRDLKSGRSRSFPIHPDLAKVLQALPKDDSYVFHGPRSGRLKPDTVRNFLVREVIEPLQSRFPSPADEKGFKDGRLHSFRHFFCSTCANSGVPERMVMEWLGHADSEMVRRYYHLNDVESRQKMTDLDFGCGADGTAGGPLLSVSTEVAEQQFGGAFLT
jgi:integrase